jgi:disulfide bond formation protein DsbB
VDAAEVADVEGVLVSAGLVVAVLGVVACLVPAGRRQVLGALRGNGALLAAAIALVATAGSLWFSEGAGFPPCELCWYQRIAMYPLVAVLGLAALRDSATGRITGLVVAGAGSAVSAWHVLLEAYPSLDTGSCDAANPCTIRWVEGLGVWTIPRLAAGCFVLIITLTSLDHLARRADGAPPATHAATEAVT